MSKKVINQKTNFDSEFLNSTGSDFIFDENPINRLKNTSNDLKKDLNIQKIDKVKELEDLKEQINSISDCNLKNNSKKMVLGDGNINSPIMLVGEAPGLEEDNMGQTFLGGTGDLLKKMLNAINIFCKRSPTSPKKVRPSASSCAPGASPINIIGLLILPSPKTIFFEPSFKLQLLIEFIRNLNSFSSLSLSITSKLISFFGRSLVFFNLLIGFSSKIKLESMEFSSSEL